MSRPTSGLCQKHDIDPVWDECPCCRVEELERQIEELSATADDIAARIHDSERCSRGVPESTDRHARGYRVGLRYALELIQQINPVVALDDNEDGARGV